MDNDKLFDILEKLLDECEYFCQQNPTDYNNDLAKHCGDIRKMVFDEKSNLSFSVISKDQLNIIQSNEKISQEVSVKLKELSDTILNMKK